MVEATVGVMIWGERRSVKVVYQDWLQWRSRKVVALSKVLSMYLYIGWV